MACMDKGLRFCSILHNVKANRPRLEELAEALPDILCKEVVANRPLSES